MGNLHDMAVQNDGPNASGKIPVVESLGGIESRLGIPGKSLL